MEQSDHLENTSEQIQTETINEESKKVEVDQNQEDEEEKLPEEFNLDHLYQPRPNLEVDENGRYVGANPKTGGLDMIDSEGIIQKCIGEMISKVGQKILSGEFSNLMAISAPAYMHNPYSFLDCIAFDYLFIPQLLAKVSEDNFDPVERLKHFVCAYVAGWNIGSIIVGARSPLNPILGETSQRQLPDGTKLYMEQVSHHPPISSILMVAADNQWKMYGYMEYKVNMVGITFSAVRMKKLGQMTIEFADGAKYSLEEPVAQVEGLLSNEKVMNVLGNFIATDTTNNLKCTVTLDPHECTSVLSNVFSGWLTAEIDPKENVRDFMHIKIENTETQEVVAKGSGSWLQKLQFENDEEPIWSIGDNQLQSQIWHKLTDDLFLESDSIKRIDGQYLHRQEWDQAEKHKHILEELQRADKRARIAAQKKRKQAK